MWNEWTIPAGNEHRFEVSFENSFTFKLVEGTAEIFGSELALGREYTVSGCKLAIFSFTGARILHQGGPCSVEYLSSEPATAQEALLNLSVALEGLFRKSGEPARVLLMGVGRNSAARTLTNYSIRRVDEADDSKKPVLVDLDVANGSVCLPGSVSAMVPERALQVDDSWHSQPQAQMISLFYGSTVIADNPKVYQRLFERLAGIVNQRLNTCSVVYIIAPSEANSEINIISTNTSSNSSNSTSTNNPGGILQSIKDAFKIDHIVVIGNERLHVTVNKNFPPDSGVKNVLKVPRSSGVVSKDAAFRRAALSKAFKSYFYGPRAEFHPFSLTLPLANLTIYRVADASTLAPSSALPLGATRKIDSSKLTRVTEINASQLLYSILACVRTPTPEYQGEEFEDALMAPVAGFLHVLDADEAKQTLTVLAPCPGSLPSRFLLLASLKWIEK